MNPFRNKLCIMVFFVLISVGQAYPMAAVFKLTEAHQCMCNQQGRKCVHGCDISHRHGNHDRGHAHHEDHDQMGEPDPDEGHHRHHASHHKVESKHEGHHGHHASHHQVKSEHTADSHWVAPRCSQGAKLKLLSLQSDPFLLSPPQAWRATLWSQRWEEPSRSFQDPFLWMESPPPRLA